MISAVRSSSRARITIAVGSVLAAAGAILAPSAGAAAGATFVVNSAGDGSDAKIDGKCATAGGDCTLRAAIQEANANTGAASINFKIPGTGVKTIAPFAKLPSLTNAAGITIDGYTQPGARANTDPLVSNAAIMIEIKGKGPQTYDGLTIQTSNNTIRGLSIYNFWKQIGLQGTNANNNTFIGNYICTNAAGTFGVNPITPYSLGIMMQQGPSNNVVGTPALADRNVISGCGNRGVTLSFAPTTGNKIQNNIIGLNPSGTAALRNWSQGVDINYTYGNIVGGSGTREGNVLSGNGGSGIEVSHGRGTHDNLVTANLIGATPQGGVAAYAGNMLWGIRFEGAKFCGDPAHENPNGCTEADVAEGLPHDNVATYNVIVSNGKGGVLTDKGHHNSTFSNNWIGVTPTGTAGGNKIAGVQLQRGVYNDLVVSNTIANNPVAVRISSTGSYPTGPEQPTYGNTISQNSMYAGAGTTFAYQSSPTLVNNGIQAPVLTAKPGRVVSGATCAGCKVELFIATNSTGKVGKTYLTTVTAAADGTFTSPALTTVKAGQPVTADATDSLGNTSMFATPVVALN